MTDNANVKEKARFAESVFYPAVFLLIIWLVKIVEVNFNLRFGTLGIYPLHWQGLPGIIFSPLIHGDYYHLFSNSGPILILGTVLFYLYREIAFKLVILAWLITGLWVWFGGREAYHIGASGLIYALASFLFFSGIIRRSIQLMAVSLVVVFMYGGMVWGIFPLKQGISWESHLMGGLAGFVLSVYYKEYGPQRKKYSWEYEEEEEEEEDSDNDEEVTNSNADQT